MVNHLYATYVYVFTDGSSAKTSSSRAFAIPSESTTYSCYLCYRTLSATAQLYVILIEESVGLVGTDSAFV